MGRPERNVSNASITSRPSDPPSGPRARQQLFLDIDDQPLLGKFPFHACLLALKLCHALVLRAGGICLAAAPLRRQRALGRLVALLAPAREHRGIEALPAHERSELAGLLAQVRLGQKPPLLTGRELSPLGRGHHLRVRSVRRGGCPFASPPGSLRGSPRGRTHLCTDQGIYLIRVYVPACLYFKFPRQVSQLILARGDEKSVLRTEAARVITRGRAHRPSSRLEYSSDRSSAAISPLRVSFSESTAVSYAARPALSGSRPRMTW